MSAENEKIIKALKLFTENLSEIIKDDDIEMSMPYRAYCRLIEKKLDDENVVATVLSELNIFMDENLEILKKCFTDHTELPSGVTLRYNDKIYIDICDIVKHHPHEAEPIYKYILYIAHRMNPSDELQELLKRKLRGVPSLSDGTKEGEMLDDMMGNLVDKMSDVNPTGDPLSAVMGLMADPAVQGFMNNIQSGNYDQKKMMKALRKGMDNLFDQFDTE